MILRKSPNTLNTYESTAVYIHPKGRRHAPNILKKQRIGRATASLCAAAAVALVLVALPARTGEAECAIANVELGFQDLEAWFFKE